MKKGLYRQLRSRIGDWVRYVSYRYFHTDEGFVRARFRKKMGRELQLENPVEFSDKIQWLKLKWYDPRASKAADKYRVREVVKEKIGEKYLNELYAVYDSVDEINLEKLPKSFVLKGTHGSGYNIICRDKDKINWDVKFKEMKRWLRTNYFWQNREWVYKDIKPRIVCERMLTEGNSTENLTDYKIYCFDGKATYCQVIRNEGPSETIDFYDRSWNHMPFTGLRQSGMAPEPHSKPERYEEMLMLAERLAEDYPFVRVDFYYVNNKIYFGELTFFPASGNGRFKPEEWNKKMGSLINLPVENENSA